MARLRSKNGSPQDQPCCLNPSTVELQARIARHRISLGQLLKPINRKDSKPQNQGTRSVVEVSPLVSYAGEHMDELGLEGRHFPEAYDLDLQVCGLCAL
eukprot:1160462-Pelagomonas_calceolata.AAC.5